MFLGFFTRLVSFRWSLRRSCNFMYTTLWICSVFFILCFFYFYISPYFPSFCCFPVENRQNRAYSLLALSFLSPPPLKATQIGFLRSSNLHHSGHRRRDTRKRYRVTRYQNTRERLLPVVFTHWTFPFSGSSPAVAIFERSRVTHF